MTYKGPFHPKVLYDLTKCMLFYAGMSLHHNRMREQGCPRIAALYPMDGKK